MRFSEYCVKLKGVFFPIKNFGLFFSQMGIVLGAIVVVLPAASPAFQFLNFPALIVIAICTASSVYFSKKISSDADKKVADISNDLVVAKKTIEESELKIAQAEESATLARLEAKRVTAHIAWRSLTDAAVTDLRNDLVHVSMGQRFVSIRFYSQDPECASFANQLISVLRESDIKVGQVSFGFNSAEFVEGVWLVEPDMPVGRALIKSFSQSGISVQIRETVQQSSGVIIGGVSPGTVEIFIGTKSSFR